MRPPVPVSTLPDAAKWLSELSGSTISERELLGHAFNFQWAAEHPRRPDDLHGDVTDNRVHQPGTDERIIQALIPADAGMRVRTWRIDGFSDRPASREQRLVALDSAELFDLLTYDDVTLTLPRPTDPVADEDEYDELVLDGAIVTHAMTRIYARGLHILAAWWQSTVGAASTRMSTPPAALPAGLAQAPLAGQRARRKYPTGGDALTSLIWSICGDLTEAGQHASPVPVMAALKARADDPALKSKYPLLSSVAGGVKWEDAGGEQKELTARQLEARVSEWRRAVPNE